MKINRLLQTWPRDTVALSSWLRQQGVSTKLAEQYRKRGWIDAVGRGAYIRRGDTVGWSGAVHALQRHAQKRIHPGGRTALELHGLAHTLPLGRATLELYGVAGERLPVWFQEHDWAVRVRFTATALFEANVPLELVLRDFGGFAVAISPPERAMLEVLDGVTDEASFEEARLLMEGLTSLRPELVDVHMQACRSVKAKRLFLLMAEDSGHTWRKRLTLAGVDLGSGKRQVVRGGRLDSRYQITVPQRGQQEAV